MYLLLGLGVWFRLDDHWWLNTSVNYQHESNGGMKQPNKGINWPTAGIALSFQKNTRPYIGGLRSKEKFWINYSPRWGIGVFGIGKRAFDEKGNSKRQPLLGLSFQVSKQIGRINALTVGTEVFMDESLRIQLKQDSMKASPVRAGLLAGHEFILGKFLFSQRLGLYLFDQTPYYDKLYHRWGIYYRFNRNWGIGFNLQAHRQVAEFVDLRIAYTFQKNYK